jgi:hypothetical protein
MDHIKGIINNNTKINLLFPPCDISSFVIANQKRVNDTGEIQKWKLISIGQFRPEKNHEMQIDIVMKLVLQNYNIVL